MLTERGSIDEDSSTDFTGPSSWQWCIGDADRQLCQTLTPPAM